MFKGVVFIYRYRVGLLSDGAPVFNPVSNMQNVLLVCFRYDDGLDGAVVVSFLYWSCWCYLKNRVVLIVCFFSGWLFCWYLCTVARFDKISIQQCVACRTLKSEAKRLFQD